MAGRSRSTVVLALGAAGAVPVVAMIASGAIFELGLLGGSVQTTIAAFVVAAALVGVSEASFWTTVVELGGRYGGTAAGLMNTGGNLGGALSPSLTPLLSGFFATRYGVDSGWRLSLAVAGASWSSAALVVGRATLCKAGKPQTGVRPRRLLEQV